jgi:predicted membrane protein
MTPRSYRSVAELPPAGDSRTAGELTVDLSQLDLDADATYTAHVGTGRLEVVVPPEANVALRYRVGAGVVEAYGSKVSGGSNLAQTLAPAPLLGQQPTLTLDLSVDRGELEVRR